MNHRIYEERMFAYQDPRAEPLAPEQLKELENHLEVCQTCRQLQISWREVESHLSRALVVSAKEGFAGRWQTRLASDRQRLHRRQTLLVLAFCVGAAVSLLGSLFLLVWPWMKSPDLVAWFWLSRMFSFVSIMGGIREGVGTLFQTMIDVIPLAGWVFLVGIMSELAVLWVVSFRILTNPRRISA